MPMISEWLRTEERDANDSDAQADNYRRPRAKPPRGSNEEVRDPALLESINEHNDDAKEAS